MLTTVRQSVRPFLFSVILLNLLSGGSDCLSSGLAQDSVNRLTPYLTKDLIPDDQALRDVRRFSASRIRPVPEISTVSEWKNYSEKLRESVLRDVVFRGQAAEWRTSPGHVEMLEEMPGGPGYRIRKLRYEALPDLWIPALLYVPEKISGKVPVFLNVNGHDRNGKAADYKQTRCIHLARNGIIALNTEWFGMGQLATSGYSHGRMNQLDLCGTSGLAPFYLAMSRALDLLLALENADPERVGVAGLSGGGWQTILISSLDPRVTLCNPVAGYSSFRTRAEYFSDLGDSEQTPTDLGVTADYAQLTTLLAPRAALLTYNEKDNCCFASAHALPPLMDAAVPVYRLLGQESRLRTHVNSDPGDHNFLLDNRQALYRMIRDQWFNGEEERFSTNEKPVDQEIRTADVLNVPLAAPNQTFQTLAQSQARKNSEELRNSMPDPKSAAWKDFVADHRSRLQETVKPVGAEFTAEAVASQESGSLKVKHWKLVGGTQWVIPVTEFSDSRADRTAVVISDSGRSAASDQVERLLKDGYRVFVADLQFQGELRIAEREYLWALMIATTGERPLGVQTGQLTGVIRWIQTSAGTDQVKLVTNGTRSGVIGLVAAVLDPSHAVTIEEEQSLGSLGEIIEQNLSFEQAPELFCFGLQKVTDIPVMRTILKSRLPE
ncbi:MAG: alpha/beta hydrolase family protein [Planctomyces sp.]